VAVFVLTLTISITLTLRHNEMNGETTKRK
jgi:hypothetical protein